MKTRKLADVDVFEISFIFAPGKPAVPGARPLIIKGEVPFLEREDVLQALRELNVVVEGLKAAELAKQEQAQREAAKPRRQPRIRAYDEFGRTPYEQFESFADTERRRSARADFYAECRETGIRNAGKQSDYGR